MNDLNTKFILRCSRFILGRSVPEIRPRGSTGDTDETRERGTSGRNTETSLPSIRLEDFSLGNVELIDFCFFRDVRSRKNKHLTLIVVPTSTDRTTSHTRLQLHVKSTTDLVDHIHTPSPYHRPGTVH